MYKNVLKGLKSKCSIQVRWYPKQVGGMQEDLKFFSHTLILYLMVLQAFFRDLTKSECVCDTHVQNVVRVELSIYFFMPVFCLTNRMMCIC